MLPCILPLGRFKEISLSSKYVSCGKWPTIKLSYSLASVFWIFHFIAVYFRLGLCKHGSMHTLKCHGGWTEASLVLAHRLPDLACTEIGHWYMHHKFGSIILTTLTWWYSAEKAFQRKFLLCPSLEQYSAAVWLAAFYLRFLGFIVGFHFCT